MSREVIQTVGLSKVYGADTALEALDWSVPIGSIVGVLGPNGAGKSTLSKLLAGITRATSGSARVLGTDVAADPRSIRRRVAFVPEDKLLYDEMKVETFLGFYGSYFPTWDAKAARAILQAWGIPEARRIRELSKGNRAKLVLGASLCRRPEVLLLDEPTVDLDPASVEEILALLGQWTSDGDRAVVVNTHRVDEVERICDTILILNAGRRLATCNLDDMRDAWKRLRVAGSTSNQEVRGWPGVQRAEINQGWGTIIVSDHAGETADRLRAASAASVEVEPIGLRDIYLVLTDYRKGRVDDALESVV